MPEFSFVKGIVKVKDIESIEVITENKEGNLYLLLGIKLRNGKTRLAGGVRAVDSDKVHPQTTRFSFRLPSEKAWKIHKPSELTINLGLASVTWK